MIIILHTLDETTLPSIKPTVVLGADQEGTGLAHGTQLVDGELALERTVVVGRSHRGLAAYIAPDRLDLKV
jgi:hypothetical protein